MPNECADSRRGLVTGATGFVGSQLVARLLDEGWSVTVLTRDAAKLAAQPWHGRVRVVEGNADDLQVVTEALREASVAWYLLHSMGSGEDFVDRDRALATTFADAAARSGLRRIVYLGGLHPSGELSQHLASRVEVGEILLESGVPTAVLQAGVVIGDGSASFSMLRTLSQRLPGAIAPRWVNNRIQPIAIEDLLHYLVGAADLPSEQSRTFDVGGPDVLTYAEMMKRYAAALGLGPRLVLTAPVTTPRLGARWVGLVTPVSTAMAEPLVGSLLHDTVMHEDDLTDLIGEPPGGRRSFDQAVRRASRSTQRWTWAKTLAATGAGVAVTALVGGLATTPSVGWYRRLKKPRWQPPASAFGPVWTALYADIAVTTALTLADARDAGEQDEHRALTLALALNLVLNAGWSVVFFRARRLPLAAVWAAALTASSADLTRRVGRRSPARSLLLAPYPAWCAFATALSTDIAVRNRRGR